jgi:hypothetical protein
MSRIYFDSLEPHGACMKWSMMRQDGFEDWKPWDAGMMREQEKEQKLPKTLQLLVEGGVREIGTW